MAFAPDGRQLATRLFTTLSALGDVGPRRGGRLKGPPWGVTAGGISPADGKSLPALVGFHGRSGTPGPGRTTRPKGHEAGAQCVALAPDGGSLATAAQRPDVRLGTPPTGRQRLSCVATRGVSGHGVQPRRGRPWPVPRRKRCASGTQQTGQERERTLLFVFSCSCLVSCFIMILGSLFLLPFFFISQRGPRRVR